MRSFFLLLLVSICVARFSSATEMKPTTIQGYVPVQMGLGSQNHLLMPGLIKGKKIMFLVDTGAGVSVLDRDFAKRIGLQPPAPETGVAAQILRPEHSRDVVWVPDLQAGAMNFGAGPFLTAKNFSSRRIYLENRSGAVDGIIGGDVLQHYRAIINCGTRQVFFKVDPRASTNMAPALRQNGYRTVKLRWEEDKLVAPVTLKGKSCEIMLDTGAYITLLLKPKVDALKIPTKLTPLKGGGIDLHSDSTYLAEPSAHQLSIAGLPVSIALAVVHEPGLQETYGSNVIGLLGAEVLGIYGAIIDYEKMELHLRPPLRPKA